MRRKEYETSKLVNLILSFVYKRMYRQWLIHLYHQGGSSPHNHKENVLLENILYIFFLFVPIKY